MKRLFTTLARLENVQTKIISTPQFEEFFPNLLPYISTFSKTVRTGIPHREFMIQNEIFHDKIAPQIIEKLPEWKNLMKINRKRVCYHILRVIYCFLQSEEYMKFDDYEKNVLLWTMLLHDICKRGLPILPAAKDPFHPYASASYALTYLSEISDVNSIMLDKAKILSIKIANSKAIKQITYYELRKNRMNTYDMECEDLTKLDEILGDLNQIYSENSFHNLVVKLILLHQCIPTLQKFRIENQLSEREVPKYFDAQMLRYIKTFTMCDSNSYLLNVNRHCIETHRKEFDEVFNRYDLILKNQI